MTKKRWQFTSVFATALVLGIMIFGLTAYAADNITVQVNGQPVQLEQEPTMIDGRVMVPVTRIAEALGWEAEIGPYGVYFQNHGDLEIIPGRIFYTYYQSNIGLKEGEQHISHHDTLGGFSHYHFNYGHYPTENFEACPGEVSCVELDDAASYQLTMPPLFQNDTVFITVRDLAAAMYAAVDWDANTRTVNITSGQLPYYDGNGLPDDYRDWLLRRTYEAQKPYGAVAPWDEPEPSKEEKLRALEAEVVRLVNEIRQREGLSQLETFAELDAAAQTRGNELITKFSHTRPNGEAPASAYEGLPYTYGGENIVLCSSVRYGPEAANSLVSILMGSEAHKNIILNPDLKYIGVGAAFDDVHTLYCVQGFMK
ncbi:MAG: CAP domain-containing protein [Clostridiales bacterium]|jgi:uncharacterized protein YkwD|nr:CAP domain-containing protein [Clostridiales bacterium]